MKQLIVCRLSVAVVTLPAEYENKLYEILKDGFSVDIKWNKYRCQMTNQSTGLINNLIDPVFGNVSRLFVLAHENEDGRTDLLLHIYC